jgi:hypothetical protein
MKPHRDGIPQLGRDDNPYAEEVLFKGNAEGVGDLKTLKGRDDSGQAYVCSYWELNESEITKLRQIVLEGGNPIFELCILGEGIPPAVVNLL